MRFRGGYKFKRFEGRARDVLRPLTVPGQICIPRNNDILSAFEPVVSQGESVNAGMPILRRKDGDFPAMFPAPANGVVNRVDDESVVIGSDRTEAFEPVAGHSRAPWHMDHEDVLELVNTSGSWLLLNRIFANTDECDAISTVIIDTVHNGPLDQAWSPSLIAERHHLSSGIKCLTSLLPKAKVHIGINSRHKSYFTTPNITEHAKVVTLSDKYPQGHHHLLSRDVTGKKLESDMGEIDSSILIIKFEDVIRFNEVITQGRPLIDVIIPVAGPGVSQPGWYRVRIGTTFTDIRSKLFKDDTYGPWRIIRGDILEGTPVESYDESIMPGERAVSVIREHEVRELWRFTMPGFQMDAYPKSTAAEWIPILPKKLDTNVHGGARPCVQCNYCDEVCPVGIYPQLIWKHVDSDRTEDSYRFRPQDCIGCGLCDYVCPSKIMLSPAVKEATESYREFRRES